MPWGAQTLVWSVSVLRFHFVMEEREEEVESSEPIPQAEELRRYIGKWVALDDAAKVRASGLTYEETFVAGQRAGLPEPDLLFVPAAAFIG